MRESNMKSERVHFEEKEREKVRQANEAKELSRRAVRNTD